LDKEAASKSGIYFEKDLFLHMMNHQNHTHKGIIVD